MYSIGGTVSGLGAGQHVDIRDNGGETKTVRANGTFTFATKVTSGGAYAVVVAESPAGKTCTVTGGSGTASANVNSVAVACVIAPTFSIGGSVSGLIGQGLELVLQVPNGDYHRPRFVTAETVGINKNSEFIFARRFTGGLYLVRIQKQPQMPTQRCAVKNYLDRVGTANVTNVDIVCGEFAYVTDTTNKTISAFGIDATTGAMPSAGTPVMTGGLSLHSLTKTPDKGHLYVGNIDSNDISVFVVDSGSGALTEVSGSPFEAGTNPRGLALYSAVTLNRYYPIPEHVEWYLY
ncbi:MAG: beta-propeller fold lactonase family protein, partial [bacterium]